MHVRMQGKVSSMAVFGGTAKGPQGKALKSTRPQAGAGVWWAHGFVVVLV